MREGWLPASTRVVGWRRGRILFDQDRAWPRSELGPGASLEATLARGKPMLQGKGWLAAAAAALVPLAAAAYAAEPKQPLQVENAWQALFRRATQPPAPPDNPLTLAKVALGGRLFNDPRLSGDVRRSCASCHRPELAFSDGRRRAQGRNGEALSRNTPSLWNLAWSSAYFWDGRAPSLEAQVVMPIVAAEEMAGDWPLILRRLNGDASLLAALQAAFPDATTITEDSVAKALAAYVRSLVSPPTRFDAWI